MKIVRKPHNPSVNAPFEIAIQNDHRIEDLEATYQVPGQPAVAFPESSIEWDKNGRGFKIVGFAFQVPGAIGIAFKFRDEDGKHHHEDTVEVSPAEVLTEAAAVAERRRGGQRNRPAPAPETDADVDTGAGGGSGALTQLAALVPPAPKFTPKDARWAAIFAMSQRVSYTNYATFIEQVLCNCDGNPGMCNTLWKLCEVDDRDINDLRRLYGTYSYEDLKAATEIFLLCHAHHSCTSERHEPRLPFEGDERTAYDNFCANLDVQASASILKKAYAFLSSRPYATPASPGLAPPQPTATPVDEPSPTPFCADMGIKLRCTDDMYLEYIWTFYHDIGMLEQTLKAISLRFQNKRTSLLKNQMEDFEISYLRPITDLLWGYINDEQHRLSVPRRTVEYEHQYGLAVTGKATQGVQSIDRRSEFLSAFHTLLLRSHTFFTENSNLTVRADPFPVQNALRDLHKILFDGAHNQFSRATFSSRVEFLIGQWLLARPEIRLFLRGREMTPYKEPWMAPVDAMRRLQGWGEDSVATYRDLAVLGERLLLSIRYGEWNDDNITETEVHNWALSYKEEIQLYCHAYRSLTGVDLTRTDKFDVSQPVALIEARKKTLKAAG